MYEESATSGVLRAGSTSSGGRPVGLRDSEAEYGGADMSTAKDGGPSGTPDDTLFDRRSVHRWTRTHVWAVTGQLVRVSMSDLILIGE